MVMSDDIVGKPLTTGEIAKYCHVAYRSVLKWIEEGKLQAYTTPGRHNRVQVKDFVGFLSKYRMPIPPDFQNLTTKKTILIVDDDPNIIDSLRRIFSLESQEGNEYAIAVARDGFEAGEKFYKLEPDLILLDIRMPGMDGYEVARRIKQNNAGNAVKIIAMSAYFYEEGKEKILSLGVDACVDKPIDPDRLLQLIADVLAGRL